MKRSLRWGAAALSVALLSTSVLAQTNRAWVLLGQRTVSDRGDHDEIPVTITRGDFRAIKLTVQRTAVDFRRVVVHFRNGEDQPVELRATIPAGGESRVIDLSGGDRVIRSVEFWYDARSRGRQAIVRVLGRP
jgi:hypothetical protein